jgi:hypothetical protein
MASAYYTCNLLPVELVARCGYSPRWLGNYLQSPAAPARREALSIHPMTCPYVTQLVAAADALLAEAPPGDCLLVPGGCDAMRRLGDLLAATYPDRVFVLSMPRSCGEEVTRMLAADIARMEEWLRERLPKDPNVPARVPAAEPPALDYPSVLVPGGVFVLAGPLSDASLLRLIGQLGAEIAGLDSCTSPERSKQLAAVKAPATGADAKAQPATAVDTDNPPATTAHTGPPPMSRAGTTADEGYQGLAAEMLAVGMCPRRSTSDRRDYLARRLEETRPSSIIYARQSFCDPGAYDALLVSRLAEERGLPYLEIEVGFPFEASGPLRTRVEAFLEAQSLDDDLLDDDLLDDDLLDDDLLVGED